MLDATDVHLNVQTAVVGFIHMFEGHSRFDLIAAYGSRVPNFRTWFQGLPRVLHVVSPAVAGAEP